MKRMNALVTTLMLFAAPSLAAAADAQTSASASNSRHGRNAAAQASASFSGEHGFAHVESRSGSTSSARGVAVGLDRNGLALSVSDAVAPRNGPAVATNFNLTVGRDGRISRSGAISVADSRSHRSVTAGGSADINRRTPTVSSFASGETDRFGRVDARTFSTHPAPRMIRTKSAPPEMTRSVKKTRIVRHGSKIIRVRR